MSMWASEKAREYQVLRATGLSGDYINQYMGFLSGLEILLVIDPQTDSALFRTKLEEPLQLLSQVQTYTEFIQTSIPSHDHQLLLNQSTGEAVFWLDATARVLRQAASSGQRPSRLITQALPEIRRVFEIVQGSGDRATAYIEPLAKLTDTLLAMEEVGAESKRDQGTLNL